MALRLKMKILLKPTFTIQNDIQQAKYSTATHPEAQNTLKYLAFAKAKSPIVTKFTP